jgi:pyruvate kinase
MTLTKTDIQAIKEALKPDFDAIKSNFVRLEKKVDKGFRENRKDHNLIIKMFDERDVELKKRVTRLEDHLHLPAFKSL